MGNEGHCLWGLLNSVLLPMPPTRKLNSADGDLSPLSDSQPWFRGTPKKTTPIIRARALSNLDTQLLCSSPALEAADDGRSKLAILFSLPTEKLVLIMLTFLSVLFSSGTIFGWAPMLLVLQKEGVFRSECPDGDTLVNPDCDARDRQLNLIYTVGAFTSSVVGVFVGMFLDKFGPRVTVVIGACVNVAGFYFFGMIHSELMIDGISDDVSLMLGIMLLATGGIFQFISSFHIGFIAAEVQELVIGGCSCLFDASSCIFLFFNLIYATGVSMASIFCGFAVLNFFLHVMLWIYWGKCYKYHPRYAAEGQAKQECKEDEAPDDFQLGEKAAQQYTPVHQREFWTQINPRVTPEFTYMVLFGIVNMTRSNLFLGLVADDLKQKGDDTKIYTKITSAIVPLGFLAVPIIERLIREMALCTAMDITVGLGVIYGGISLIPNVPIQLVTAVVYTLYRALLFSAIATYNAQVFGPATMGKVAGLMYTLSAPFQLLSYPLVAVTQDCFDNNYAMVSVFQILWLIPVYVMSRWLRRHTQEQSISGIPYHDDSADTQTATEKTRVMSDYGGGEGGSGSYSAIQPHEL